MKFYKKRLGSLVLALALCLAAYGMSGTKASAASASDRLKSQTASVVKSTTKASDSKKEKLSKLFAYAEKNYGYLRTVGFQAGDGWQYRNAEEMYAKKKGSCYHFAAAYACLAKKATGCAVRVGVGKTNGFSGNLQGHAWTEVKWNGAWYICDPNMDKFAAKSSRKYFLKKRSALKKTYDNFKDVTYVVIKV